MPSGHLSPEDIFGYEHQLLLPRELVALEAHLTGCPQCRGRLARQMGVEVMVDSVRESLSPNVRTTHYWRYAAAAVLAMAAGFWLTHRKGDVDEPGPVQMALREQRIAVPAFLQELKPAHQILMGEKVPATVRLLSPAAIAVAGPRVVFKWQSADRQWRYQVRVFDAEGQPVLSGPETRETEWSTDRGLAAGSTYQWQLTAIRGDERVTVPPPSETPPKFRMVDAGTAARLRTLAHKQPNAHLLLAVEYGEAGLLEDARRELTEAIRSNPSRTELQAIMRNLPDR